MEPGHEQQTQQYAESQQRGVDHAPVRAKDAMARARTGLILLVAFITELVVIAAADNQWVSDKIARLHIDTNSRLQDGLRSVGLVYAWRFTPQGGSDPSHLWVGGLALIGTTFVVSLLLIMAVVRGPVTFGRAFFGSWMAVIVATYLGGYVRALIVDLQVPGQGSRFEQAVFGVLSPNTITFIAAVGLGLIVAIIVGIVAPLTRRGPAVPLQTAVPAGAGAGPPQPGFFDQTPDYPPWREERYGPPAPSNASMSDDQPTTALPVAGAGDQHEDAPTTALRPTEARDAGGETQAHQPSQAREPGEAERSYYGSAPQSPYAPNAGAARSPAAEQAAAEPTGPEQAGFEHGPEGRPEPKMAEPAPGEPAAPDAHAPGSEVPAQDVGPQETAELPHMPEADPQSTAQFPRPPDDEDLDPEHH